MQPIPQPSKEQVRAYMMRRCQARLPLPDREEIRRQLGWEWQNGTAAMAAPVFPSPQFTLVLPGNIAQLGALLTVEWLFLAAGVRLSH